LMMFVRTRPESITVLPELAILTSAGATGSAGSSVLPGSTGGSTGSTGSGSPGFTAASSSLIVNVY